MVTWDDVVTWDVDRNISTAYASPYKARCSAVIGWFSQEDHPLLVFNSCDWRISILAVSVICSLGGPLSYGPLSKIFIQLTLYSCVNIHVQGSENMMYSPEEVVYILKA